MRAQPHIPLPPLGPQLHSAFAVLYFDRAGRCTRRGIFSEEQPTVMGPVDRRTECIAKMRSRHSYQRAATALRRKLGWRTSYQRFR